MTAYQGTLVQLPDGTYIRKQDEDVQPEDMLVFDGPEFWADAAAEQAAFEAQIAAAGGLEAWKKLKPEAAGKVTDPLFSALDTVKTLQALPAEGIAAGTIGTVLEVFSQPSRAYLVEFANDDGETLAMPTLLADQIELDTTFEAHH